MSKMCFLIFFSSFFQHKRFIQVRDFFKGLLIIADIVNVISHFQECKEKDPDVLFIGDSILENLQFMDVWNLYFSPLHCLNFSIRNDQTMVSFLPTEMMLCTPL